MKNVFLLTLFLTFCFPSVMAQQPIAPSDLVFAEADGLVAVEAEHFFQQTKTTPRAFYLTHETSASIDGKDGDPKHLSQASGGAYLEILPDTRRNHGHKLTTGVNFQPAPGKQAVVSYKVNFKNRGRYYVWVRAYSTGSEDNGLHVGIDGHWPDSGQRLQWCQGKNSWRWESKQRTEAEHCGEAGKIFIDIDDPGEHVIHFSMREDGFEFDKWLMTMDKDFQRPSDVGPSPVVAAGTAPEPFAVSAEAKATETAQAVERKQAAAKPMAKPGKPATQKTTQALSLPASAFEFGSNGFYLDKGKWAAINPDQRKKAITSTTFPFPTGTYDVVLRAIGENDGRASYVVKADDTTIGEFNCPLSSEQFEAGPRFHKAWKNVQLTEGTMIRVAAEVGSTDGQEFSRARWAAVAFRPADDATRKAAAPILARQAKPAGQKKATAKVSPTIPVSKLPQILPRQPDGDGSVVITGEKKQWHNITLTLDGPYAHEQDNEPNPFTQMVFSVRFEQEGFASITVPGYFAADGNAAQTGAESGTKWRAHFTPNRPGKWTWTTLGPVKLNGGGTAFDKDVVKDALQPATQTGEFIVGESDKTGRDFRYHGRLKYTGDRYLQFEGSKETFVKVGADAPETLLGYADFDNTIAMKKKVPLKTFAPHVKDWTSGDPTWKNGKGKGLIGAVNYLSGKGCNAFSFLTYNAGGDGDNVWPYIDRNDKLHFDCSKLDQWGIVFDHATTKGMYLHFKLQETENDDHKKNKSPGGVPECLDNGDLGIQRSVYLHQLIARFGHNLALNWNLGEENTQTTAQQKDMINFIAQHDPYGSNIVLHTYPNEQDKVYRPLLGQQSQLTGLSLQNSHIKDTHSQTLKWVRAAKESQRPLIVAFDESGSAAHGQCPDLGYRGFDGKDNTGKMIYTEHEVRHMTLWGNLMAGGAGCEYYFGYQFAENDLLCEDWRSRDRSWDYGRIAINFFRDHNIPLLKMNPADKLIGNDDESNSRYCLADPGSVYVIYLPKGGTTELKMEPGNYTVDWFNPRDGGKLMAGAAITADSATIGNAPTKDHDWVALVRRKK